jgi:hypothetical protein
VGSKLILNNDSFGNGNTFKFLGCAINYLGENNIDHELQRLNYVRSINIRINKRITG